jgi:hypothetical protein
MGSCSCQQNSASGAPAMAPCQHPASWPAQLHLLHTVVYCFITENSVRQAPANPAGLLRHLGEGSYPTQGDSLQTKAYACHPHNC